jgi:hypothetical protein
MEACEVIAEQGDGEFGQRRTLVYASAAEASPQLHAIAADDWLGIAVAVTTGEGAQLAAPTPASLYPSRARPASALCGDLNGDSRTDFVLPLAAGGGSPVFELVVLLSSEESYRIWTAPTSAPSQSDVVSLAGEPALLVHRVEAITAADEGEPDRRIRVTHALAIRGAELVRADHLDPALPSFEALDGSAVTDAERATCAAPALPLAREVTQGS